MSKRSPIKVSCRPLLFGLRKCFWKPTGAEIRAIEFASRADSRRKTIIHRSTKRPGAWQVSTFDEDGPVGDAQFKTIDEALEQAPPMKWRLRSFG